MLRTEITSRFTVQVPTVPGESKASALEECLDNLMDALLNQEKCNDRVHDSSVGAELSTGDVEISLLVDGAGSEALGLAEVFLRTAIHAAGGFTPAWDSESPRAPKATYEPSGANLDVVAA